MLAQNVRSRHAQNDATALPPSSRAKGALKLFRQGAAIFPVRPREKRPLFSGWQSDMCKTEAEVIELLDDMGVNIGVCMPDGFIIDFDCKSGKRGLEFKVLLDALGAPPTFTVRTATGGLHAYYRSATQVPTSAGKVRDGVDIRAGLDSYVVGPGSEVPEGVYVVESDIPIADAPGWLVDMVTASKPIHAASNPREWLIEADSPWAIERAKAYLEFEADAAVENAAGDITTLKVAEGVRDFGVSEEACLDLMLEHWNDTKAHPPWDAAELAVKVANAYRYAKLPAGNKNPEAEFEPRPAVDLVRPTPHVETAGGWGFRVYNVLGNDWPKPSDYVVKGLFLRQTINMLSAPANAGKSPVILDIAAHVALGKPWLGRRTKQGYVLYVANEGFAGLRNRRDALVQQHFLNASRVPLDYAPFSVDLRKSDRHAAQITKYALARADEFGLSPGLIVIDTLSHALAGGDDSNQTDIGAVLENCKRIRNETGAAIVLLHHPTKAKDSDFRGSGKLRDDIDLLATIEFAPGKDRRRFSTPRVKDSAPLSADFAIKIVEVGIDEEGDPRKAPVVEWLESAEVEFEIPPTTEQDECLKDLAAVCERNERNGIGRHAANKEWCTEYVERFLSRKRALHGTARGTAEQLPKNATVERRFHDLLRNLLHIGAVKKVNDRQYVIDAGRDGRSNLQ